MIITYYYLNPKRSIPGANLNYMCQLSNAYLRHPPHLIVSPGWVGIANLPDMTLRFQSNTGF